MLAFRNPKTGKELLAQAEIDRKHSVNGEKSLTGVVKATNELINTIDKRWSLVFEGETYIVTYAKVIDMGKSTQLEFDAIHEFFDKMNKSVITTEVSGSHPFTWYLDRIFENTPYNYSLQTAVKALDKENWGMKNKMALFADLINSGGVEYEVQGKLVLIKDQIGSDLSTMVRRGFNMQEFGVESDFVNFITYMQGFGAFIDSEDESKGRLKTSYRSPLADVYGVLEGEPKVDERYTDMNNLQADLKLIVDSSISISLDLSLEDLQASGYPYAMARVGDYITAINEVVDFQQKVRIIDVNDTFDVEGEKISVQVTCGSLSLAEKQLASDTGNSNTINNIINGNDRIPNDWLTSFIIENTEALNSARTELKFTEQGIIATDKSDKNKLVILNSAGLGISTDGGKTYKTAITALGINASYITTGVLSAELVRIAFNNIGQAVEILSTGLNLYNGAAKLMQLDRNGMSFWNGNNPVGKMGTAGKMDLRGIAGYGDDYTNKALFVSGQTSAEMIQITHSGCGIQIWNRGIINSSATGDRTGWFHEGGKVITGDLMVAGSKNAVHVTRDGILSTPAYETAESYLGDIGTSKTTKSKKIKIPIETLFGDTVNTNEYEYQVFLQSYEEGHVWVSERNPTYFVVKSNLPYTRFAWEIKAKRRGYENDRLVPYDMTNEQMEKTWRKE